MAGPHVLPNSDDNTLVLLKQDKQYLRQGVRRSSGSSAITAPIGQPSRRQRSRVYQSIASNEVATPRFDSENVDVRAVTRQRTSFQCCEQVTQVRGTSPGPGMTVKHGTEVKFELEPVNTDSIWTSTVRVEGSAQETTGGSEPTRVVLTHPPTATDWDAKRPLLPRDDVSVALKGSSKKKASDTLAPQDIRLRRFRKGCPKAIMERADRVRSQRMFLVYREKVGIDNEPPERFKVLGSTGNVYTIRISRSPQCDCPDGMKGNVPCKHIIFVFLKVLKVPESSVTWYQQGLTLSEVQNVFDTAPPMPHGSVLVSTTTKNAFLEATGLVASNEEEMVESEKTVIARGGKRLAAIGEDCPICYEEMTAVEEKSGQLVYDEALTGCGKPLHSECFKMWLAVTQAKGDPPTCVWCRSPWPSLNAARAGENKDGKAHSGIEYSALGYMNMAEVAGMSRSRDTSTYYHGPMRGRRIWEPRYHDD